MLHSVCIVVVLKESSVRCASAGDWSFVRGQAGGEFLELFQRDTPAALQHPPEGAQGHREPGSERACSGQGLPRSPGMRIGLLPEQMRVIPHGYRDSRNSKATCEDPQRTHAAKLPRLHFAAIRKLGEQGFDGFGLQMPWEITAYASCSLRTTAPCLAK